MQHNKWVFPADNTTYGTWERCSAIIDDLRAVEKDHDLNNIQNCWLSQFSALG